MEFISIKNQPTIVRQSNNIEQRQTHHQHSNEREIDCNHRSLQRSMMIYYVIQSGAWSSPTNEKLSTDRIWVNFHTKARRNGTVRNYLPKASGFHLIEWSCNQVMKRYGKKLFVSNGFVDFYFTTERNAKIFVDLRCVFVRSLAVLVMDNTNNKYSTTALRTTITINIWWLTRSESGFVAKIILHISCWPIFGIFNYFDWIRNSN